MDQRIELWKARDNNEEIWRSIPGFPKYEVNQYGLVRYADTKEIKESGSNHSGNEKEFKSTIRLIGPDNKSRSKPLHRLIALAHVPNPNNYKIVAFKDNDETNISVNNLEWISYKIKMSTAAAQKREAFENSNESNDCDVWKTIPGFSKYQANRDGEIRNKMTGHEVARFDSIRAASKATNAPHTSIIKVCSGVYQSTGGYKWKYANKKNFLITYSFLPLNYLSLPQLLQILPN